MVNRGLDTKREDTNGKRNNLVYTITGNGRGYLKKWLSLPVEKYGLRYETLLKLFFGSGKGEEQALIHTGMFEKKTEEELPYLLHAETILNKSLNEDTAHKYYLLTAKFGIKNCQMYLEWCKEARKLLTGGQ